MVFPIQQQNLFHPKEVHQQHHVLQLLVLLQVLSQVNFHQYRFYTEAREDIGLLRKIFYPNNTKIVPKNIIEYLRNPISLAVWYQDDGTLDFRDKYHANALFATHCFSRPDCEKLARALQVIYNLDVRVCRCQMRGKLYFRLYVTSASMPRFMDLVSPYIQECFRYKMVQYRISQNIGIASSSGNTSASSVIRNYWA